MLTLKCECEDTAIWRIRKANARYFCFRTAEGVPALSDSGASKEEQVRQIQDVLQSCAEYLREQFFGSL